MATIPGADTLGQTEGAPDIAPVTYPRQFGRPNQVGTAMSEAFEKQAARQQKGVEDQNAFDYATRRSDYLAGKVQLEQQIQDDPNNWQTASARYQEGMLKLQTDTADGITDPKYQRQFAMEAGTDAKTGQTAINHWARGREIDTGRALLDNTTETNLKTAWASPSDAPQIISAHQTMLDGAVSRGYISDDESVKNQRSFVTTYAKGAIEAMPDAQQVEILGKSLPQRGAGQAAPVGIKEAIIGQESGGNPNAPASVTGARGPGQVEPATFKRFAKPGESIDNPDDNTAVSGRYVDYLSALPNVQGDPARIAVGYFSGEKNIAPPGSQTPWIRDKADPTGKTTSAYVSNVIGRTGKTQVADNGTSLPLSSPTGTPADFLDVPTRSVMLREAQTRLKADGAAASQAYAGTVRDNISYLQSGGDPSKVTLTPGEVTANVRGEEGAGLADELSHALDYNKAVTQIATATPEQMKEILAGHTPTGPADFRENSATADALFKAAQARETAIYGSGRIPGDPAGYAISAMKDVGAAYTNANAKPGPDSFDGYVRRLNGAYQTLGVAPELRSILPRANAAEIVSKLQSGSPADALGQLSALKTESGKWWPAVYRDLAHAGLPPTFQALNVVAPHDQPVMVAALQKDADAKSTGKGSLYESMKGLRDAEGASITEQVDKSIDADSAMGQLRQTFGVAGRAGVDQFSGVRAAIQTTALYLYAKGGTSAADAAAKATAMVTGNFDFVNQAGHSPARLPKGTTADFQEATAHTLDGLSDKDVKPYAHEVDETGNRIDIPKDQLSEHALRGAKAAYWVTVPGSDGNGAVRAMDPQTGNPVILAGGKPLDISFARFNFLATQGRKGVKASEDKTAAMMAEEAMNK